MKSYFIIVFCSFICLSGQGQNLFFKIHSLQQLSHRPKIGLALSGGAAHGIAHLGVIKYLEERSIPIDYVTGTSIGAIVGGMYAMGYSFDEMKTILEKYDWNAIITNQTKLNELAPREKWMHDKIPLSLRIEENRILLPEAIFDGNKLDSRIKEIFSPALGIASFDSFPRPFRCFSVDLLTGDVICHQDGDLAESIRASMAIPSVFSPIRKDSMLLVDGGLLKNFPVLDAYDLGADIVIGVNVGSKRYRLDEVRSLAEILKLSGFVSSYNDTELQKKSVDILLEPDVKDLPILDFQSYEKLILEGYKEAQENGELFDEIENLLQGKEEVKMRSPLSSPENIFIEEIMVTPSEGEISDFIRYVFSPLVQNKVSLSDYDRSLLKAFATKDVHAIDAKLIEGKLGEKLEVGFTRNVESEIGITANYFNNTNTSLVLTGHLRNAIGERTMVRGLVRIGDNPGATIMVENRVGISGRVTLGLKGGFYRMEDPVSVPNIIDKNMLLNEAKVQGYVNFSTLGAHLFRIQYGLKNRRWRPKEILLRDLRELEQNLQELKIHYEVNTLDRWSFPTSGIWGHLEGGHLHNLNQEVSFTERNMNPENGIPATLNNWKGRGVIRAFIGGNSKWNIGITASSGWHKKHSLFDVYRIGGSADNSYESLPFIGSSQGEYRMRKYAYGRIEVRRWLNSSITIAAILNNLRGESYNSRFLRNTTEVLSHSVWGGGVQLGYASVVGPFMLELGYNSEEEKWQFSVGVGYRFID